MANVVKDSLLNTCKMYAQGVINVCNDIQSGSYTVESCEKYDIDVKWFRRFLDKSNKHFKTVNNLLICKGDWHLTNKEQFLKDLLGVSDEEIVVLYDFDEAFDWAVSFLQPREQMLLNQYYFTDKTYDDLGVELGISSMRVGQLIKKALRKLRNPKRVFVFIYGLDYYDREIKARQDAKREAELKRRLSVLTKTTLSGGMLGISDLSYLGFSGDDLVQLKRNGIETPSDLYNYLSNCMKNVGVDFDRVSEVDDTSCDIDGIERLELPTRIYNALCRSNINTVPILISKTEKDLFRIRNIGRTAIDEINASLSNIGLSLKSE